MVSGESAGDRVSPDRVRKTRFTPSESSAGHGLHPQRPPTLNPESKSILAEIIMTKEFPETIIFVIFLWSFSSFFS